MHRELLLAEPLPDSSTHPSDVFWREVRLVAEGFPRSASSLFDSEPAPGTVIHVVQMCL